jgi:hypothetical protein
MGIVAIGLIASYGSVEANLGLVVGLLCGILKGHRWW